MCLFLFLTDCCKQDMVQKRGSIGCHCVYPIKLDIILLNVSDTPSWNLFLNEFATQLGLLPHQIELINFYMLSLSRMNISMDIIPHSGISFSASQAAAINSSLINHKIQFSNTLVGDYKLLNLTWFEAPAPSQGNLLFYNCIRERIQLRPISSVNSSSHLSSKFHHTRV